MKFKTLIFFVMVLVVASFTNAATLKGSVYNDQLDLEQDVIIEIDTIPAQQYLAKDGRYEFELSPGKYELKARKGFLEASEEVEIVKEGSFVYDVFLLPSFAEEDELWKETQIEMIGDEVEEPKSVWWRYLIGGAILVFVFWRYYRLRKKYGPLRKFRKEVKIEHKKTVEEHKAEIAREPGYLEKVVEIIKKNDGRISQKQLRKEMLHLSEAKVSLILTELEHKGRIEKIKKGRGNIIILKNE